ncbi:hypothetical protein RhiirA4_470353 [Rhizophagus irregularis]|uniref:Uncharacterized protein n=1 Tax=Rhizophagus irregularis TaxID=588596 RepID=A0A2I1H150_9GLOM|nr:hypothetical protein RhiirA4_470353 [Rhizophagus irregularis]
MSFPRKYLKRQKKTKHKLGISLIDGQYINIEHHELGRVNQICTHCGAKFWIDERNHNSSQTFPSFAYTTRPPFQSNDALLEPPSYFLDLYASSSSESSSFRKNIRACIKF